MSLLPASFRHHLKVRGGGGGGGKVDSYIATPGGVANGTRIQNDAPNSKSTSFRPPGNNHKLAALYIEQDIHDLTLLTVPNAPEPTSAFLYHWDIIP